MVPLGMWGFSTANLGLSNSQMNQQSITQIPSLRLGLGLGLGSGSGSGPGPKRQAQPRTRVRVVEARDKGNNRGPLWRGRVLSSEAIQAVQALKRADRHRHTPAKLQHVLSSTLPRLLKNDLLSVLHELQRQHLVHLALQVFEAVRREAWYKPDTALYTCLIETLGRSQLIDKVQFCLAEMQKEGLAPDTAVCTATIGAFLNVGMVESALETFELMKQTHCYPDKSTFLVLIDGLTMHGELEHAAAIRTEGLQFLRDPLDNTAPYEIPVM